MLLLSRKVDQGIVIGDHAIYIKVIAFETNSSQERVVTLGISAPKEISVHRDEIFDLIDREKQLEELKMMEDKR